MSVVNIILFLWEYYSLKNSPFFIVSIFFLFLIDLVSFFILENFSKGHDTLGQPSTIKGKAVRRAPLWVLLADCCASLWGGQGEGPDALFWNSKMSDSVGLFSWGVQFPQRRIHQFPVWNLFTQDYFLEQSNERRLGVLLSEYGAHLV